MLVELARLRTAGGGGGLGGDWFELGAAEANIEVEDARAFVALARLITTGGGGGGLGGGGLGGGGLDELFARAFAICVAI